MRRALALAVLALACRSERLPEGVTALHIADPRGYFAREGFVQLVPPVHVPSSSADVDQVEIWAKLPDGATIEATGEGVRALRFPPGSVLERVEHVHAGGKRWIVDVRGTRIDSSGKQWFHVYRRGEAGLFGFEWARGDEAAQRGANEALRARLARTPAVERMPDEARAGMLDSLEGKNDCAGCHVPSRPDNTRQGEHGLVNRGTDASGFFTPWTVLVDEAPIERYGSHDLNAGDAWVAIRCPGGAALVEDAPRPTCRDDAVPLARRDLADALAAGDRWTLDVCAARRALGGHLDASLRHRFAAALAICDASP